jgi:Fe-S-cluster containining protein
MAKLERGRCGLCCTLLVRLSQEDILRIRGAGFKDTLFVDLDSRKDPVLQRINGYCRFVKIEQGIATCTIYAARPKICRDYICVYPGEDDCRLKRHYSVTELESHKLA